MQLDFFHKISDLIFSDVIEQKEGNYHIYDKKKVIVQDKNLDFLKQFEKVSFRTFIRKDNFEKRYENSNYYSSDLIIVTERTVNVHEKFSTILFFFIINELKEDIQRFLYLLTTNEFKLRMGSDYKEEEFELQFGMDNNRFFDFMYDKVPNFIFIRNLLKGSKDIYRNGNYIFIKIEKIKDILKENNTVYNFHDYKLYS